MGYFRLRRGVMGTVITRKASGGGGAPAGAGVEAEQEVEADEAELLAVDVDDAEPTTFWAAVADQWAQLWRYVGR